MNERNTYIYIHDDASSKSLLQAYCIENGFSCVGIIGKDDLEDIENLIHEKDVKYIVLANLNRFLDEVLEEIAVIFTTDLVAIVDIANDERLVNNTLNKEAFELMIKSRRSGYVRTYSNIKGKNRVAIYHMSLDPIRAKCIDVQLESMRLFAKEAGWTIVGEYLDLTNAPTKKKDFERLVNDTDNFDILLVKNAYYINRKTPEYVKWRNLFWEKGVVIYSMTEGWC